MNQAVIFKEKQKQNIDERLDSELLPSVRKLKHKKKRKAPTFRTVVVRRDRQKHLWAEIDRSGVFSKHAKKIVLRDAVFIVRTEIALDGCGINIGESTGKRLPANRNPGIGAVLTYNGRCFHCAGSVVKRADFLILHENGSATVINPKPA